MVTMRTTACRGGTVVLGAILTLAGVRPASAGDPPRTPEAEADAVVAAVGAADAKALAALAALDQPDPWIVADELTARGEVQAALAFARAAPRPGVDRLADHIESRRGKADAPTVRAAVKSMSAAILGERHAEALTASDGLSAPGGTVLGVRFLFLRGLALRSSGRHDDAAAAFLEAAAAAESLGWLQLAAWGFEDGGWALRMKHDPAGALATWERQIPIEERRGDRTGAARALLNVGIVQQLLGRLDAATASFERCMALAEETRDPRLRALALGNLGNVRQAQGDYPRALALQERALKLKEEIGDRAEVANTLGNIGCVLLMMGEYARSREATERARTEKEGLGDRAGVGVCWMNLGLVHRATGDLALALECLERSRRIAEATGDVATLATCLGNVGTVHDSRGDHLAALRAYEESLRACERIGDRVGVARARMNIGSAQHALGRPARALEEQERALRMWEEMGARANAAVSLANLASLESSLGNPDRAAELLERAHARLQEAGDRAGVATVLGNLGSLHAERGDPDRALSLHQRALSIKEALGDRRGAARTLANVGAALERKGDLEGSFAASRRALALAEEVGDANLAAQARQNLGLLEGLRGHDAEALALLSRGVEEADRLGAAALAVRALMESARVRLRNGENAAARDLARRAVDRVGRLYLALAEEQGARGREEWADAFDIGAYAAIRLGDLDDACFFLESARAASFLEAMGGRARFGRVVLSDDLRHAEADARAREASARASLERVPRDAPPALLADRRAALEAAKGETQAVLERIQREAKTAADLVEPPRASLSEIRSLLAADEALLTLRWPARDETLVLVATRGEARVVTLTDAEGTAAACDALLAEGPSFLDESSVAALRERVARPLALPGGIRRVLVAPDGILSYVPFALLFPDREVAYIPSGTTYRLLVSERDLRGEGVLALGDPDYGTGVDARTLEVLRRGRALVPLPGTRDEAKAVGDVVLLGRDATEERLRAEVGKRPRWRAVHLACHSLVDADRATLSSLALTPSGDDDGFLTALELFRTRIPSDLVVLSACETARGRAYRGEGVVGLTRAFLFAGSPRVVASLWKVDDRATHLLMGAFYDGWLRGGLGAAAALREAQRRVREHEEEVIDPEASRAAGRDVLAKRRPFAHPRHWAAWVLWGLPR